MVIVERYDESMLLLEHESAAILPRYRSLLHSPECNTRPGQRTLGAAD